MASQQDLWMSLQGNLPIEKQMLTAVSCDMQDILKSLIGGCDDVNMAVVEQTGDTALHIAATKGHTRCAEMLLNAGADPNTTNKFGITPIANALRYHRVDTVEVLFATGSILTDPSLVWSSETGQFDPFATVPVWASYPPRLILKLLVATSDFIRLDVDGVLLQHFYDTFLRTGQNEEVIKMYLLTGNTLTTDQYNHIITMASDHLALWLRQFQTQVQSLQHYCTLAIRRELYPNTFSALKMLPLPDKMKQLLVYK